MSSKKVLIITYYWPPSGGSGVQRWLKFVKYLDKAGWDTFVMTPENPSFTIADSSLAKDIPANTEVLKLPIWEPYDAFYRFLGVLRVKKPGAMDMVSSGKKSLVQRMSNWVRGNLFIPDPRIFWVKPATSFLMEFIESNQIGAIITTGPPHSIHLVGLNIKKKNPAIKWVADFRDPWSAWDLLDTLNLTRIARRRHEYLERKVLQTADRVITIAQFHVDIFERKGGRKVDLITNGYDADDFKRLIRSRTDKFTIRHTGVLDALRDPRPFMNAVVEAFRREPSLRTDIRIDFIGTVNADFQEYVRQDATLSGFTSFIKSVPHDEIFEYYRTSDVLLLILAHTSIANGNLPGKFFEYLNTNVPILAVGPVEGDAGKIISRLNAGYIIDRDNQSSMVEAILKEYGDWKSKKPFREIDPSEFGREKLTTRLIALLESL